MENNNQNSPGEELIEQLDTLRKNLLELTQRLDNSGTERTQGLREMLGSDCRYYRKSLDLFLCQDYIDIRNLVKKCNELFEIVDP